MNEIEEEILTNLVSDQILDLWHRYLQIRPELRTFFGICDECKHLRELIINGNIPIEDGQLDLLDQIIPPGLYD